MALWDMKDANEAAANSKSIGGGEPARFNEGNYHVQLDELQSATAQAGYQKWIAKMRFVACESEDGKPAIGKYKNQHFNTEHPTQTTADSARNDMMAFLKLCGVDVSSLRGVGDLFEKAVELTKNKPVLAYKIKPQDETHKFLNWYPKGRVDGDKVFDINGVETDKWGSPTGAPAPAAVETETASNQSEDLGL